MKKFLTLMLALALSAFASDISIDKIYAKESTKNATVGAVFMNIQNNLGADIKLIGVNSSVCDKAEIHTHKMVDGMKMMTQIDSIDIPAASTVELKPDGLHIMLMGLKKQLVNGDEVDLELQFDTGMVVNLKVDVVNNKRLFLEK